MAVTINASTTAGLISTADTSGVLALQTAGTTAVTVDASQNTTFAGTATATKLIPTGTSVTGNGMYLPAANSVGISTNGTNAVYIDSSQNVGIGVVPSTWTLGKAIEVSSLGTALWSSGAGSTSLTAGAYYNSGWKYANGTTKPGILDFDNQGKMTYYTAIATGLAGGAISLTQLLAVEAGKSLALQGATVQAGAGITFPATQSASTNANTLDDYEEGTWTPALVSGAISYAFQVGTYVKIGKSVTLTASFNVSSRTSSSSGLSIQNLPFTSDTQGSNYIPVSCFPVLGLNRATATAYVGQISPNSTTIAIYGVITSSGNNYLPVLMSDTGSIIEMELSVTYISAS